MKTLYLVRHAHTQPPEQAESDFTRVLTPTGEQQGSELAAYWQKRGYGADFAMCSAASRAEQTFEYVREQLGTDEALVSNNFYSIEEEEILNHIRECGTRFDHLFYVGHNPGVAFFAMKMAKVPPEKMVKGFSPCSLCVFQFDIEDWSELDWHMGEVTDYWMPPTMG